MAGMGFIWDFNKKLEERKQLSRRKSRFEESSDNKEVKKVPNHIKQQVRKENKRRNIISAVVTIILIVFALLMIFCKPEYV